MSACATSRRPIYVYLICLAKHYFHARHYVGSSVDPERRLREHRSGRGSHFTKAIAAAGIEMRIVRLWPGERYDEVLFKLGKNAARSCPDCREQFLRRDRERRRAKRELKRLDRATSQNSLPLAA